MLLVLILGLDMLGTPGTSLAMTTTSCGYSTRQQSCSSWGTRYSYVVCCDYLSSGKKSNKWCILSTRALALNCVANLEVQCKYLVSGSKKADDSPVEFGSVFKENDNLIGSGMGCPDLENLEKQQPPWGRSSFQPYPNCETSGANLSSTGSGRNIIEDENTMHFLEERNEVVLSERIMRLSRSNKLRSAMELFRSMEYSGLQPTTHACNSFISCLLRTGMVDKALRIFGHMRARGTTTGHTYSLMLKAVANARGCDAAFDMFEEFEKESDVRKDFDAVVYNTMISVSGKVNNWVQSLRIWRSMKENGLIGTTITYCMLVCIFVRCGQNELAIDAYLEMVQNRLMPREDAMQAIIGACSKEGNWEMALNVFQSMLSRGLKPNMITCNALINSLGKAGKVKLAFGTFNKMKSLGHQPDEYTWNALLGAFYRANQHTDVLHLFECIEKGHGSPLNLHLYNTCLMSCQRLGFWDKALQLLWQMEPSGLVVPTASYNLVIGACEVARKPKTALQVYEHMLQQNCSPDKFTFLSIVRVCIWGSLWHEVEDVLNVTPDGSLYNAAIQGMCLRGQKDLAVKLYTKMREHGLKPDGKTRALMLQSLPKDSVRPSRRK